MKEFVAKVGQNAKDHEEGEDSISCKCTVLNQKLDALLKALNEESEAMPSVSVERQPIVKLKPEPSTSSLVDDHLTEDPVFEIETIPMSMPIKIHVSCTRRCEN